MPSGDHSALEQAQRELRVIRAALDDSLAAVAIWELDGGITYVNPAFVAMWQYEHPLEVRGTDILHLFDDGRAAAMKRAVEEKVRWVGRLRARRRDGTAFPVLLRAGIVEDHGGALKGVASGIDLSHTERFAKEALDRDERLRALHDVERSILSARSSEEIALIALRYVCQATSCQRAGLAVFDLTKGTARLLATLSEGRTPVAAGATWSLAGFEDLVRSGG